MKVFGCAWHLLLVVALACSVCARAAAVAEIVPQQPIVILLSWDGMRHDYAARGEFPGLQRLDTEGLRAQRLHTVMPSTTFPGHVSMATGTYPDRHGIVDNRFLDRKRGQYSYSSDADWLQAEPLCPPAW